MLLSTIDGCQHIVFDLLEKKTLIEEFLFKIIFKMSGVLMAMNISLIHYLLMDKCRLLNEGKNKNLSFH